MLVHIFQHRLDTILLTVTDRPDAIKLQALAHGTLKDKHRRGTRARDKVNTLWIEVGYRTREDGVMPAREQSDTVGTYQRTAILVTDIQDTLFEQSALVGLLTEAGGYDNERTHLLLLGQQFHVVRTILGGHHQDSQVRRRQLACIMEGLDTLHLVLFGIHYTQRTLVATT